MGLISRVSSRTYRGSMELDQLFDKITALEKSKNAQNFIDSNIDRNILLIWNHASGSLAVLDYKKYLKSASRYSRFSGNRSALGCSPKESKVGTVTCEPGVEDYVVSVKLNTNG